MPIELNLVALIILLGVCSKYGEVEIGEGAIKKRLDLERGCGGDFAVLSDMLSEFGRFSHAEQVQNLLGDRKRKTYKVPGIALVG